MDPRIRLVGTDPTEGAGRAFEIALDDWEKIARLISASHVPAVTTGRLFAAENSTSISDDDLGGIMDSLEFLLDNLPADATVAASAVHWVAGADEDTVDLLWEPDGVAIELADLARLNQFLGACRGFVLFRAT
jgi:hypothetical protein